MEVAPPPLRLERTTGRRTYSTVTFTPKGRGWPAFRQPSFEHYKSMKYSQYTGQSDANENDPCTHLDTIVEITRTRQHAIPLQSDYSSTSPVPDPFPGLVAFLVPKFLAELEHDGTNERGLPL